MKRTNKVRLTESQLHKVIKESAEKVLREDIEDNDLYQVNITTSVDDEKWAFVTRYSQDGYRGTTIGTRYADGYDSTEWCVFVGSRDECEDKALEYNS